jgi:hypothetical protein
MSEGMSAEDAAQAALFGPAGVTAIVGAGYEQVWDRDPDAGPVAARDAYIGHGFRANLANAEERAERTLILSATYGVMTPEHVLLGPEIARFDRPDSHPIGPDMVRAQLEALAVEESRRVLVYGLRTFCVVVAHAVRGTRLERVVIYPFGTEGYPLRRSQAAKRPTCPRCGGSDVVPIAYGLPGAELWTAAAHDEVILGGCVLPPDGRDTHCTTCGNQWFQTGRMLLGDGWIGTLLS